MWKLALRRPRRQEERWECMEKKYQRTRGQKKHPRKRGDRKHLRKREERLGFPARRMDRSHGALWMFGRKGGRTAKEGTIRSTAWTISGSISTETFWWTTTTRSSSERWSPRHYPGRPTLTGCSRFRLFYSYKFACYHELFRPCTLHRHTNHVRREYTFFFFSKVCRTA
ncbi:unnamed protein product [Ectocarpus sp. 4 AP-2014]